MARAPNKKSGARKFMPRIVDFARRSARSQVTQLDDWRKLAKRNVAITLQGRIWIVPPCPRDIPSLHDAGVGRGSGRGEILPPIKAPNSKLQTPKKLQVPSSKAASLRQVLEFEVWDFSGAWCLGFGVSFSYVSPRAHP